MSSPALDSFVGEHRQQLEALRLLGRKVAAGSTADFGPALRSLHSLKGTSSLLGLATLARLAHAGEELLLKLRRGETQPPARIELLAEALDDALAAALHGLTPELALNFLQEQVETPDPEPLLEEGETRAERRRSRTAQISVDDLQRLSQNLDFMDGQTRSLNSLAGRLHGLELELSGDARDDCRRVRQELRSVAIRLSEGARLIRQESRRLVTIPARDLLLDVPPRARQLASRLGKQLEFRAEGWDLEIELPLLQALLDPLWQLTRNAVVHGLETPQERLRLGKPVTGVLTLSVQRIGAVLRFAVSDDGRGVQLDELSSRAQHRLDPNWPFEPGLTTANDVSEDAGRGQGMVSVRARARELGGDATWSAPHQLQAAGGGSRMELVFLQRAWDVSLLSVRCGASNFALPTAKIRRLLSVTAGPLELREGRGWVSLEGQPWRVLDLAHRLGLPPTRPGGALLSMVQLADEQGLLLVDSFGEQMHTRIEPLPGGDWPEGLLQGCCLLEGAEVGLVLEPDFFAPEWKNFSSPPPRRPARLLVVDDSDALRSLHASQLGEAGFHVTAVANGQLAWDRLGEETFDLVLSDVQMPVMDGLTLLSRIRAQPQWRNLPVILLTSLSAPEEQRRGLQLGADEYLLKQTVHAQLLLDTVVGTLARSTALSPIWRRDDDEQRD